MQESNIFVSWVIRYSLRRNQFMTRSNTRARPRLFQIGGADGITRAKTCHIASFDTREYLLRDASRSQEPSKEIRYVGLRNHLMGLETDLGLECLD